MLKGLLKSFIIHSGLWSAIRANERKKSGAGISILYGHRVLPDRIIEDKSDARRITGHTSVSQVAAAIKLLNKYYKIISIDEAVQNLKDNNVSEESVVLTFDDGFGDNFKYLYPLLKELNTPATFYVNPSVVGTNKNLWFQSIINFFFAIPDSHYYMKINSTRYELDTPEKRYSAAFDFMQYIQAEHKPQSFINLIEEIMGDLSNPQELDFHMSWSDLSILASDPLITIGAHTQHHFPLGYCDEELSKMEIFQSVADIENKLGSKVDHFSYPRGHSEDFSQFHIDYLKSINVKSATSTIRGVNRGGDDLFSLKRIGFPQKIIGDETDFLWYVSGIPQLLKELKNKFKARR